MDYYSCSNETLHQEIARRGYQPLGSHDQLSEGLKKDDDRRGPEATTVRIVAKKYTQHELELNRTAEFGISSPAALLVGEKIVHYVMNSFFPTLQLFFESGLSCILDGGKLRDAHGAKIGDPVIGLDRKLRFRLTDITHEEDGHLVKTSLPEKFVGRTPSIAILEATVAQRTSIAVKYLPTFDASGPQSPSQTRATIVQEKHVVVGLRLEGMQEMGYVWAKASTPATIASATSRDVDDRTWGDVRIAGIRDDAPTPFLGFPQTHIKPGGEATVVSTKRKVSNAMVSEVKK